MNAIKILLVEENEDNAVLLHQYLQDRGIVAQYHRVDTRPDLLAALEQNKWDLIISKYLMPGFSGLRALRIVRSVDKELPFIVISGTSDEESAVEIMRAGAQDFIAKSKLSRLVPAILRELNEVEEWRQTQSTQAILQAQTIQAQRLETLGHLVGGVAYDFYNLLSTILNRSESLVAETKPANAQHESAKAILKTAQTAFSITQKLLNFSNRRKQGAQSICLNQIVDETMTILSGLIGKEIVLDLKLDDGLLPFVADRTHIEQVIMNLVINARHAITGKGRIEIETGRTYVESRDFILSSRLAPGSYVRLRIRDTGCGMDPDCLQKLYTPHYTAWKVGNETIMGLVICNEIVKQYNGAIFVKSRLGKGTTLDVYFSRYNSTQKDTSDLTQEECYENQIPMQNFQSGQFASLAHHEI